MVSLPLPLTNSSARASPFVTYVSEIDVIPPSVALPFLDIVILYVSGVARSKGIVNGSILSSVLKSLLKSQVDPVPDNRSKLFPLSNSLPTDTTAALHG